MITSLPVQATIGEVVVHSWKSIAGLVAASAAVSACAAVMVTNMPLPGEAAALAPSETPVANTSPDAPEGGEADADVIVGNTEHSSGKHIALTFDDGPDPAWTPQVLDLLAQYGVQATFCLVGTNAEAHPDLVQQIVDAGHVLCGHTMTHQEGLPSLPVEDREAQIVNGLDAIRAAVPDAPVPYFRAPFGAFTPAADADPNSVQRIAARHGMRSLGWSIDTEDWTQPGEDAIVSAMTQAGTNDVVLMHDGGGDRQQTLAALERCLPWLVDQGYEFDLPA